MAEIAERSQHGSSHVAVLASPSKGWGAAVSGAAGGPRTIYVPASWLGAGVAMAERFAAFAERFGLRRVSETRRLRRRRSWSAT